MKTLVVTLSSFLLMLVLSSCGKRPNVSKNNQPSSNITPTEAELYFNAFRELEFAVASNDLISLKRILAENSGINLNIILNDGDTLLIKAIKKDFTEIRNYLLENNADPNIASINQETPLMVAINYNRQNSLKVLLDLNVNLDKKNKQGDTALHLALKRKLEPLALLLIKEGANLEIMDGQDKNAYSLAQNADLDDALELIHSILQVEQGAPDLITFRSLLGQGDFKTLNSVLSRYPNLATEYQSINPFKILVNATNENIGIRSAQLLLDYNVPINGPSDAEITPLIMATIKEKKNFVLFFLVANADTQLTDKDGKSALYHAIHLNNLELVNLLLDYSANKTYSVRKNGKKFSFNACKEVRSAKKKLSSDDQMLVNQQITESLKCGLLDWPF